VDLIANKGMWIVAALIALIVLERAFPASPLRHRLSDAAKNLGLAVFNVALSPLIVIPLTAWAASHALDWRPAIWSGWSGMALDILLLDCWIYFWHRINHEWNFLWRFHEVHHLDETLDATSALRFHFGEVLLSSLVRAGVILLLDVPLSSVIVFEVAVAFASLFHHSNLHLPGWIEQQMSKVIVTPSIHWVHHHAIRADTDSNYGTIFAFWDPIFRTRSITQREPEMKIGVEGAQDQSLPELVLRPFSRR
jgi:sterol desaturase/sphingolipid hydroxylase (fatty acid hydroxylase superfamily)